MDHILVFFYLLSMKLLVFVVAGYFMFLFFFNSQKIIDFLSEKSAPSDLDKRHFLNIANF